MIAPPSILTVRARLLQLFFGLLLVALALNLMPSASADSTGLDPDAVERSADPRELSSDPGPCPQESRCAPAH